MLERRWEVLTENGFTPIEFKDLGQGMIVRGFEEDGRPVKSAEGFELHSVKKPPFLHPKTGILTVGMLPVEVRDLTLWERIRAKLAKWGWTGKKH